VDSATGNITTFAGSYSGVLGDNGLATAATLSLPIGVAVASAGNLFIADSGNHRIRKVSAATGIITTVAGTGEAGYSGDNGPATSARLNNPEKITLDSADNLYIADTYNYRIRKVAAATGIITTVAGIGSRGYAGDNGPAIAAQLSWTEGIAVDSAGNLFIADSQNSRIRKVSAGTGIITTISGISGYGFSGDNGPATAAKLFGPFEIAIDLQGNLFFCDTYNDRIRAIRGLIP
jgi:hypothetical protein